MPDVSDKLRDMLADMPDEAPSSKRPPNGRDAVIDQALAGIGHKLAERQPLEGASFELPRAKTGRTSYQNADRLAMLFMRYSTSHVIRQIIKYAVEHGRPEFAEGTYRKVLNGDNVFAEAVNVVSDFHDHVEHNLRAYYLPKPPLPVTREEACEYMKRHGKIEWFYDRLFTHKFHATFRAFFNLKASASETLVNEIVDALRGWHEELYKAFDEWESIPDRWSVWHKAFMKIQIALFQDETLPFFTMSDDALVALEAEMRGGDYAWVVIQGRDLHENPRMREQYLSNVIMLEAARVTTEQHGQMPNKYNHQHNIPH